MIPRRDFVLGLLVLILGSFSVSAFISGILFYFYFLVSFNLDPIFLDLLMPDRDVVYAVFMLSGTGVMIASSFAYMLWFSSFQTKGSFKEKSSFLTHTSKDVTWVVALFILRLITLILGIIYFTVIDLRNELFLVVVLSVLALFLRENNHLKISYKLSWKLALYKLLLYSFLILIVGCAQLPLALGLNHKLQNYSLETKFGISLPEKPKNIELWNAFYDYDILFYHKSNGKLYLSHYSDESPFRLLSNSSTYVSSWYKENKPYWKRLAYGIDKDIPMKEVDSLVLTNFKVSPSNSFYFYLRGSFNYCYVDNLFIYPSYIIKYKDQWHVNGVSKNLEGSMPPPPPPPWPPYGYIDLDTRTIEGKQIQHLHLANDRNYYWNDNLIDYDNLAIQLDDLIGTSIMLVITYDDKVKFGSIVNLSHYISTLAKTKMTNFTQQNGIDLETLQYTDNERYKELIAQFSWRSVTLPFFYSYTVE